MRSRLFDASRVGAAAAVLLLARVAVAQDPPIVYVRCARTAAQVDVTGQVVLGGVRSTVTRRMRGADVYDVLPDVVNFYSEFSGPCDLMFRAADGTERVLHDCSTGSTSAASCSAMDPSVSFDGRTVAYAVFRGTLSTHGENVAARVLDPAAENTSETFPTTLPNRILTTTEAQLYLVDLATGQRTALPHQAGDYDSGPTWLPNGRLAFTSTRDQARSTMVPGTNAAGISAQLWSSDPDGRNADFVSHHGLGREEHPSVLRDGRLVYSSWQIFGALPFRYTNGSVGGSTTIGNMFNIFSQNPDGSNHFAFFGQHCGDHIGITSINVSHEASHFLTQASDGRVWFSDYYRGNNNGMGAVFGVMPEPDGIEGLAPTATSPLGDSYAPHDIVNLAAWSINGDQMSAPMPAPALTVPGYADPLPFAGRLSHVAGLPGNGLMATWGKGACSTNADNRIFTSLGLPVPPSTSGSGQGVAMNVVASLNRDTPGCDTGIYVTTRVPSLHPNDLRVLVDHPEWHELMAHPALPYAAIHGVPKPAEILPADRRTSRADLPGGTPFGLLGAASILDRETAPARGIHFAGEHQWGQQGTDTIDYTDDALCGVRILGVQPNRGAYNSLQYDMKDLTGERVVILGEFPVRNLDGAGAPRMDPSGHPDTSFLARFPANVPYLMQGIDCDGRTLNSDQTWQSLRPGEQKACGGCHVHSKPARVSFAQTFAATAAYAPVHLGEGQVPLLAGADAGVTQTRTVPGYALQLEFERDVMPIFASRCVSCHSTASPGGGLALDRPGTDGPTSTVAASTWWCLVQDRSQSCLPAGQRFVTNAGSTGSTTFRRPQATRYVRVLNALGSLLYWKAAGRRTDGRTDATFTDSSPADDRDLDFGPAHPTTITPDELGVVSRWIDIGAPGGAAELKDTIRPTLTLAAVVTGGAVSGLKVGTVDVPSGIDPATLTVCLVDADGGCGPNLAPPANPHGVVDVPLAAALSQADVEVRATVRDRSANETVVTRTVGALLDAPVTAWDGGTVDPDGGLPSDGGAPGSDGGAPVADGGTPGPETVRGACGCGSGGATVGGLGLLALALLGRWGQRRRATL